MASDEVIERLLKGIDVETAFEPERYRNVVGVILWPNLIQKPKAFLNERNRQAARATSGRKRKLSIVRGGWARVDGLCESRNCGCIKKRRHGQIHIETLANA